MARNAPPLNAPEPNDASPFLPERRSLKALREAAAGCRGCHLWRRATQTVFGEGPRRARVMLVGEQPGDREERGRRRIHATPKKFEVDACTPWLREELRVVKPRALVVLGATAGKALFGSRFTIRDARGAPIESDLAPFVTATIHPSAILRARDDEERRRERVPFELRIS
jgi:DNA polymerase